MRAFIAIELPQETKDALARLQGQLEKTGADVKWVEPQNIHLTLKFLGEINDEQLKMINLIIDEVAKENPPYKININELGAFPKIENLRVIWVGIDTGDKETKKIAQALEEKIQKLGIPKEDRAFSSHITIGRTRSALNRDILVEELKKRQENFNPDHEEFTARKITLFKSTLSSAGPTYEPLKEGILTTT
ncbi:MAG: RNA 2',3'-cyclic phosphodiesterase [Candidatus Omnitrophica bacterium]|nr:RNA 2',3'-cyclic phosphodiesterase [Candidatus Omnitrophota bacterium]